MQLETALDLVRRHRGPIADIGLRQAGERCYIVEATGETYPERELIRLALELQQESSRPAD